MIKVNVDDDSIGNPDRLEFGGLLANFLGGWIIGFAGSWCHTTNINAKLCAIFMGYKWFEISVLEISYESDSQIILTFVNDVVHPTHPYTPLIDKICSYMLRDLNVRFVHTLREGSSCTNWIAKLGVSLTQEFRIILTCCHTPIFDPRSHVHMSFDPD